MKSFRTKASVAGRLARTVCLTAVLLGASTASGQTCRPIDGQAEGLIAHLKRLSSATDEQSGYRRLHLKIPVVDTSTITLVSTTNVCNKVLQTFLAQLPPGFTTPLPTSLYVVKVGSVYVGMHFVQGAPVPPGTVMVDGGDTRVQVVVDSKYKFLSKFAR